MKIATKTRIYKTNPPAQKTGLFNCKEGDLRPGKGIPEGTIVLGSQGFAVAERKVHKVTGIIVKFQPNRRCIWNGLELNCMVKPGAPEKGIVEGPDSHAFNYIVAKHPKTGDIINLEIARFNGQGKNRRAELI